MTNAIIWVIIFKCGNILEVSSSPASSPLAPTLSSEFLFVPKLSVFMLLESILLMLKQPNHFLLKDNTDFSN